MTTLKAEKKKHVHQSKTIEKRGFRYRKYLWQGKSPNPFPLKWREPWRNGSSKPATKAAILLDVDGQVFDVLIKDICFNSMKGLVEEIDFQALVSGEKVHSVAEIILLNHDKVISGVLQQRIQEISYKALPDAIIDKVKVDVGDMKVGDIIRVGDLDIAKNKNIELVTDLDTTVATVIAVHAAAETADEAAPETKQTGNVL